MEDFFIEDNSIKRRLRKAYSELLMQKEYKKINICELVGNAEMSRTVFYKYYNSFEDFENETTRYLAEKISRQMLLWLCSGRKNLASSCKKKNLLPNENNRVLFSECYKQMQIAMDFCCFEAVQTVFYEFIKEQKHEYADSIYAESRYVFFLRGFAFCTMELFAKYDSKKAEKELGYIFDIADTLFPENIFYTK